VILLPSILPFLIGIGEPSGPIVEPVSVVPSALNSQATGKSPLGVTILMSSSSVTLTGSAARSILFHGLRHSGRPERFESPTRTRRFCADARPLV
jgi:hypothetical protein